MYVDVKLIKRAHLALMVLDLILCAIVAIAALFLRDSYGTMTAFGSEGMFFGVQVATVMVEGFAMVCGIGYAARDYRKDAADYYKYFMLLYTVSKSFALYASFVYNGFSLNMIVMFVEIMILGMLTFVKDLGRQRTTTLFYVLLVCELIVAMAGGFNSVSVSIGPRVISALTRLLLCGTLGLAIWGKYDDKARRGTN